MAKKKLEEYNEIDDFFTVDAMLTSGHCSKIIKFNARIKTPARLLEVIDWIPLNDMAPQEIFDILQSVHAQCLPRQKERAKQKVAVETAPFEGLYTFVEEPIMSLMEASQPKISNDQAGPSQPTGLGQQTQSSQVRQEHIPPKDQDQSGHPNQGQQNGILLPSMQCVAPPNSKPHTQAPAQPAQRRLADMWKIRINTPNTMRKKTVMSKK